MCCDSSGWWSSSSVPMEHRKYPSTRNNGAQERKCSLSRFTWTPPSSPAGINRQYQHWQHAVTVLLLRRDVQQTLKHKLILQPQSRAHSGGCHRAAQQPGTVLWLPHFGNLPRHHARRSHGKTALSSRIWLINAACTSELQSSFQWVLKHKIGVWITLPG